MAAIRLKTSRFMTMVIAATMLIAACAARTPPTRAVRTSAKTAPTGLDRIETIVVIYAENRSFDNLYGSFPGANGLANAPMVPQVDHDGKPMTHLPAVRKKGAIDSTFPANLPNQPFAIDRPPINSSLATPTGDLVHQFCQPSGISPAPGGDPRLADPSQHPLPPQTSTTIGDTLTKKGVDWTWYAGAWNAAVADGTQAPDAKRSVIYNDAAGAPNFQAHHQPFNYFANFAPGTAERDRHLKDYDDFTKAIAEGQLPPVAFYKPQGSLSEHAGYTDVLPGDRHVADVVAKLIASPQFPAMVIIVTYDENGGWWDHVAPPSADRWGPGTRIPAIIVSLFAKGGKVDHTLYDTTSILKLITRRFALEPLPGVRPGVGDLTAAFTFGS
jgi:phospholipase C